MIMVEENDYTILILEEFRAFLHDVQQLSHEDPDFNLHSIKRENTIITEVHRERTRPNHPNKSLTICSQDSPYVLTAKSAKLEGILTWRDLRVLYVGPPQIETEFDKHNFDILSRAIFGVYPLVSAPKVPKYASNPLSHSYKMESNTVWDTKLNLFPQGPKPTYEQLEAYLKEGTKEEKTAEDFSKLFSVPPTFKECVLESAKNIPGFKHVEHWNAKRLIATSLPDRSLVEPTSYLEVFHLIGTSGVSRCENMWTWTVLGVVITQQGKQIVAPGDTVIQIPHSSRKGEYLTLLFPNYLSAKELDEIVEKENG